MWANVDELETKSRLVLRDDNLGLPVTPQDLGVGISQLVPIVVLANDPDTSVAAIEQPELHVHPRLQAELGDLFIYGATEGENYSSSRLTASTSSSGFSEESVRLSRGSLVASTLSQLKMWPSITSIHDQREQSSNG